MSAFGMGQFLHNGSLMEFRPNMRLFFDYRAAIADGVIRQVLYEPNTDTEFLKAELYKLGISPEEDGCKIGVKSQPHRIWTKCEARKGE